jgi:capsule polysaccharide export protein KpsE/RkpR
VQDGLISRFGLVARFKEKNQEDARRELSEHTQVAADTKSGIITVKVTAKDPGLAADLAKGYVEELNRVVEQSATSAARRERIFLEGRLATIKKDLDQSSKDLGRFSSNSAVVQPIDQAKLMMEAEMKLQSELAAADAELASLRQTYSEDNVRIRALEAKVAELQRQSERISGSSTSGQAKTSQLPSLRNLPLLGLTYADLFRQSQTEEMLWATLTKQYETAKVQEAREIPTVRLLDAADLPLRKSSPQRGRTILGGALLGFIAGCIAAVLLDFWQSLGPEDERKRIVAQIRAQYFARRRG